MSNIKKIIAAHLNILHSLLFFFKINSLLTGLSFFQNLPLNKPFFLSCKTL